MRSLPKFLWPHLHYRHINKMQLSTRVWWRTINAAVLWKLVLIYFQCSYQKFCECVYDHKLVNRNKRCNFKFWEKAMQLLILCKVKTKYIERFLSYEVFWKKLFVIIRGNSSKGGPPSFVSNIKWIRACLLTCNSADIIKKP